MDYFSCKQNILHCEEVPLSKLAEKFGTPLYVYSYHFLIDQFARFDRAFGGCDHLICYSMKANSNKAVLRTFIRQGAGVDVVSGGELQRALWAGAEPQKIVYSGVGKTEEEIRFALKTGILQFNVEAAEELTLLDKIAVSLRTKAPMALRVNPDVDAKTHSSIATGLKENKFGISEKKALPLYRMAQKMKGIRITGIDCHIGSQLTEIAPIEEAAKKIAKMVETLQEEGILLENIDMGGGLGITYRDETPPTVEDYAQVIKKKLGNKKARLILEPGRFLVGNSSVLVTRVICNKEREDKRFVVVDAASNDLMRPVLYDAYHQIQPVSLLTDREEIVADIVGPVCESGDFFALNRSLKRTEAGELLAIMSSGAYGFSMSSNYNSRPRAAELMVKGGDFFVVRERERVEDLVRGEKVPCLPVP